MEARHGMVPQTTPASTAEANSASSCSTRLLRPSLGTVAAVTMIAMFSVPLRAHATPLGQVTSHGILPLLHRARFFRAIRGPASRLWHGRSIGPRPLLVSLTPQ